MENKTFTEFALKMELSDLIFQHHMKSYMTLNLCIITLQFILLFLGITLDIFFDLHFSRIFCAVNIALCLVVILNNIIHDITWKKAKRRAEKINKGIDYLCCNDLNSDEGQILYHRFMAALVPTGCHAKHMKNSDKK